MPRVSVITPCYNRARFLPETIESVLGQPYPDIEHIVIDDGSTDDTPAVLAGFADRVRLARHENIGEQRTVNRGIEMATGEFVVVVNSDDTLLPGAVPRLVSEFDRDPDLVAAYPDWRTIDTAGRTVSETAAPAFDLARMLCFHECHPGPGAMVRAEALRDAGGRDATYRYVADFDLWLRLGLVGPIRHVPEVLATWRVHPAGATAAHVGRAMAAEHIEVIRRFFDQPGLPRELTALRRRAMSWARCAAAYHAGQNPALRTAYALGWVLTDPVNLCRWYARKRSSASAGGVGRIALRRLRGETGGGASPV